MLSLSIIIMPMMLSTSRRICSQLRNSATSSDPCYSPTDTSTSMAMRWMERKGAILNPELILPSIRSGPCFVAGYIMKGFSSTTQKTLSLEFYPVGRRSSDPRKCQCSTVSSPYRTAQMYWCGCLPRLRQWTSQRRGHISKTSSMLSSHHRLWHVSTDGYY